MHPFYKRIITVFLLSACRGYSVPDEPKDSAAAIALAQRFLRDLDTGQIDDLLAISEVPFWGDGQYLGDLETFETIARREAKATLSGQGLQEIHAGYVIPFSALEAINFDLYRRILSKEMNTEGLFGVFLSVKMLRTYNEGSSFNSETLLIFVRKNTQGQWRVVGIDD